MPSKGTLLSWATVKDGFCLDGQSVRDSQAIHLVSLRWLPGTLCQVGYPVEGQDIPRGMSVCPVPLILPPERVESEETVSDTGKRVQRLQPMSMPRAKCFHPLSSESQGNAANEDFHLCCPQSDDFFLSVAIGHPTRCYLTWWGPAAVAGREKLETTQTRNAR